MTSSNQESSGIKGSNDHSRSRRIRVYQRIFSIILLIVLISVPVFYSWPAPSKTKITAVKLNVRIHALSETQISIIVSAVDESGKLDPTRDDEVELHFEGSTTSKLENSKVRLENGTARVGLHVLQKETSFLKAKWIRGPTPLKDATILVSPLMWDY